MNKLRKRPPNSLQNSSFYSDVSSNSFQTSRTLQLAQDMSISLQPVKPAIKQQSQPISHSVFAVPPPASPSEKYWAARAISAEILLAAREANHRGLQELFHIEGFKRSHEVSTSPQHKGKYIGLEKVAMVLLLSIFSFAVLVVYLVAHYPRPTTVRSLPSHFTISILSPFTSVVEHETSVIGSKTITMVLLLVTGLTFLFIRHRLS